MKVITFGAVWCPDCLIMKPIWDEIIKENPWIVREHYDVDENPDKAKEYNAVEIPIFVFLDQEGNEIERMQGEVSKDVLVEKLNKLKNR